ncbi:MAG: hypothetical protein UH542_05910 [Bacteroidales bacterium]|nr:hypothetical protein [Bacteroidales bacterium]
MENRLLNYQLKTSYALLESIDTNVITVLRGKHGLGKKHIIKTIETNYEKYPIVTEVNNINELYTQMLTYKNNKTYLDLSLGYGDNLQLSGTIISVYRTLKSFLTTDFSGVEEKIIQEFKDLSQKSNLLFSIQINKNITDRLLDFIFNKLSLLNIRILLIIDDNDFKFIQTRLKNKVYQDVFLECQEKDLISEFSDFMKKDDIKKLIMLTDYDLKPILEIYKTISESSSVVDGLSTVEELAENRISTTKNNNIEAYSLLEFLSFFEDVFTKEEIKTIHRHLQEELLLDSNLLPLLKYVTSKKILQENYDVYSFVLLVFKQIIKAACIHDSKYYYEKLALCYRELYPLDLYKQYKYFERTESGYLDILIFRIVIRLLRSKDTGEVYEWIKKIKCNETKTILKEVVDAYNTYNVSQYEDATIILEKISPTLPDYIVTEVNYLLGLCYWKRSENFKKHANKYFENIISNENAFEETILLSKMALLSIYSNDQQYHKTNNINSQRLYNDIKNFIIKRKDNDKSYLVLYNILKRKANCVYNSKRSISDLQESYEFFREIFPIFNEEFYMSLCNYAAILLTSGETQQCYKLYKSNISFDMLTNEYTLYNYNNYLIAKCFSAKLNLFDLKKLTRALNDIKTSFDTQILIKINIASFYLIYNQIDTALKLYEEADLLNNGYDDYFEYLININKCSSFIIGKDYLKAKMCFEKSNFVPELYDNYDSQYIILRNEIIKNIIINKIEFDNLGAMNEFISRTMQEKFTTNNSTFFSKAVLFTDIQFWTDN